MTHADIIIVGAGHNGLVAAAYLAKAGKRVLVLERNAAPGGQLAAGLLGTGFDAPALHPGGQLRPDIVRDLELARHGFATADNSDASYVSLLPDGEVHACRKFPSPIGDINRQSLEEIYRSAAACTYRRGCRECDGCRVRAVCGGCLAVAFGCGLDPLARKDPACFIKG